MTLADYLAASNIDETSFAARLGVSAKAVRHWLEGARTPRSTQMQNIVRITNGAVTPNDFLPPPLPPANEAAE